MKRRSTTPWKKSRTYGDIHGGRTRRRFTDNIVARAHSLQRPAPGQALPVLLQDNPSREFFFPVSVEECAAALHALPAGHGDGITHIWLRRRPERMTGLNASLAEFIYGSGVRVVVLYPWRVDGRLYVGRKKPKPQHVAPYVRFGASIVNEHGRWYAAFSAAGLKRFYIEHLFCHEVGHHVDRYSRRHRQAEEFADQYAVQWGPLTTTIMTVPYSGGSLLAASGDSADPGSAASPAST
ncbi:hypothetical protein [Variovorax atrisoli]|uniref:hypothetical protein n=1 Tax=Variovorax atrisoli TaxID=3394203 RepID=UPI00160D1115|nr:hypothetical protein [Variovorax sp. BK613]MBB3637135.1 hypothetical protein [Variovorax sp. BK613]